MTYDVRRASLVRRRNLSARVSELSLEVPGEPPFRWHAGQHLAIHPRGGDSTEQAPLWYSIASAWDERRPPVLELAIGAGVGGDLLAPARAGDELLVSGPYGNFALPAAPAVLLVGVGTGVAPLRAFSQEALARAVPPTLLLLVGARTADDLLWRDELTALAARNESFRYAPVLSRPHPAWPGLRGYVQQHLAACVSSLPPDLAVRACGSEVMVEAVLAELPQLGLPPHRIDAQSYSSTA